MNARVRFGLLLGAFVALTGLGVWWAMPSGDVAARAWRELAGLGVGMVVLLIAIAGAVIGAEMVRLVVFGRALGVRVTWRAAFDASVANDLFSWISPGGWLGEPASVYVMTRRGVPVDGALAITFGKFATSFAVIMGTGCVLLALGYGPAIPGWAIASIGVTIGFGVVLVGGFVVGAWWPEPTLRWLARREERTRRPLVGRAIAAARRAIERLARFRGASWLALLASHVLYYGAYVGLIVVLGAMFDASSLIALLPIAIVYQAFTYIAPAPGIPEAGAAVFFGGVLSDGGAFVVVLLFRGLTAYFQILIGLVYLPAGGMLRAILTRQAARAPAAVSAATHASTSGTAAR